jgi:uncharacterized protein (TIGR03437 family)
MAIVDSFTRWSKAKAMVCGALTRRSVSYFVCLAALYISLQAAAAANYFYDNAGRLTKVDYGAAGVVAYTYDPAGNLISRQVQPPATTSASAPVITAVVNAEGGSQTIAPNTWVEINGTNLSPAGDSRTWGSGDFANNQLPTQLDNVSVTVNGKSAFVYYISPTQVNILTPPDPMQGTIQVQITNGTTTSAAVPVQAQLLSPSFFVFSGGYVCAVHLNGSLVGPTTLYPGASTPAAPGETILVYGNGFGPAASALTTTSLTQSGPLPSLPAIKIGGLGATVLYAGVVSPGLYQFNVTVPIGTPNGDNPIAASYKGLTIQGGSLITISQ